LWQIATEKYNFQNKSDWALTITADIDIILRATNTKTQESDVGLLSSALINVRALSTTIHPSNKAGLMQTLQITNHL
jgi:hypothetical protein